MKPQQIYGSLPKTDQPKQGSLSIKENTSGFDQCQDPEEYIPLGKYSLISRSQTCTGYTSDTSNLFRTSPNQYISHGRPEPFPPVRDVRPLTFNVSAIVSIAMPDFLRSRKVLIISNSPGRSPYAFYPRIALSWPSCALWHL